MHAPIDPTPNPSSALSCVSGPATTHCAHTLNSLVLVSFSGACCHLLCDVQQRGREAILRVHLKKIRSVPRLNVSTLASRTEGFSGADLAALVQDATRLAARRRCDFVGEAEFEVALQRARARFGAPQSGDDENFPFDYDGGNRNRNGNGRRRFSLDLNSILRAFGGGSDFNDQPRTSSPLRTSPAPDTPLDDGHPASPLSHGPPVQ